MKAVLKLSVVLVMIVVAYNGIAQPVIKFQEIGFNDALTKSKAGGKPVFMMCYASWCSHCNNMKRTIFTDSVVAAYYNNTFICISQDMEKGAGPELQKSLKIQSYPTFIFFDGTTAIYRVAGEFDAANFITQGRSALTPQLQLPYLKLQFEKDVSNYTTTLEYLKALKKGGLDYSDVVKKYFSTQSDQQLLSAQNWRMIAQGVNDIGSREFQFVLSHQAEFSTLASPERVERKIIAVVSDLLSPLVAAKDTIVYASARQKVTALHLNKVDSLVFVYDLLLDQVTGNWTAYNTTTVNNVEKYVYNNYQQLNTIVGNYISHVSGDAALAGAEKWMRHSLDLHHEYGSWILAANLYKKLKNKQQAIAMANNARDLAIHNQWEHADADLLLKGLNAQ
jgi:thioredoxin-related protein